MRGLWAIAVIGCGMAAGQARADAYAQQVTSSLTEYHEDADGYPTVSLPGFDPDLGTLTSVTLQVKASTSVFASGLLANTEVPFQTSVDLAAPYGVDLQGEVNRSTERTNGKGTVEFFSPALDLSDTVALEPDYLDPDYKSGFEVHPAVTVAEGYVGHDGDLSIVQDFEYQVTETFSYTPIPEPASWSLLGGALIAVASCARWRRSTRILT